MDKKLTTGEVIVLVAGVVMFLFGFLAWYDIGGVPAELGLDDTSNAWDQGLFPIATYVPLIGLLVAGHLALVKFASVSLPDTVGGFGWRDVYLIAALFAVLLTVGFLIADTPDKGVGFWLDFLGSIGLLVGVVMLRNESTAGTHGSTGL